MLQVFNVDQLICTQVNTPKRRLIYCPLRHCENLTSLLFFKFN